MQHITKHEIENRIKIKTLWVGNSMKKHSTLNRDIKTPINYKRTMPEKCLEITWLIQIDRKLEELLYVPELDRWHIPRLGNNCWRYVPCWCNFCGWCFQRRYCLIVHKKSWIWWKCQRINVLDIILISSWVSKFKIFHFTNTVVKVSISKEY